jgi:PAS domain S-box-containing protein
MQPAVMSLDDLQASSRPAWLWDGARARIVWANPEGIAQFGGETLFDLIDLPFDLRNSEIARIADLCLTMERGEVERHEFSMPIGEDAAPVLFDCTLHALPDGRNGLLMVASAPTTQTDQTSQTGGSALLTGVLEAMPIAIVVAVPEGNIVFSNRAAAELLGPDRLASLGDAVGGTASAEELIRQTLDSGTVSTVRKLQTTLGEREVRITARRLDNEQEEDPVQVLVMLEDVTERRALERALSAAAPVPIPPEPSEPASPEETGDEPEAKHRKATSPETLAPATSPDPYADLSAVASAIRQADAAQTSPPPSAHEDSFEYPVLPDAVTKLMNETPNPIILHRAHVVFFANPAALALLKYDDLEQLCRASNMSGALREEETADYRIITQTGDNETAALAIRTTRFPWHDGVMWQSRLRLAEPEIPQVAEATPVDKSQREQTQPLPDIQSTEPSEPPAQPPQTERNRTAEPTTAHDIPAQPATFFGLDDTQASRSTDDLELRALIDIAADGLIILNSEGEIVNLSAGAEALFGFRLAEVAGKPLADLLEKSSRKVLNDYLAALEDSGVAAVFNDGREVTGIVSQGGEISLFMTISRLQLGSHARYRAVLRDITQWKKTEAELRTAIKDAEMSSAQKSEFLASISHELRTPLNAILGFSDVMRSERFGPIGNDKYLGYINDIHQSGTYLLSLINDLLDLSKVEAGKMELNFTSVDLSLVTAECTRLLQDQAKAARVVIRQNIAAGLPNVVADERAMKQIVLNILSNAIKFTDPGGQVIISAKLNEAGELAFKVKDTGIGMSPEELEKAVEPFSRIDKPGRAERPGTGLGLPLTRALTEANRARFTITSARRKGTLVEIVFPTTRVLAD